MPLIFLQLLVAAGGLFGYSLQLPGGATSLRSDLYYDSPSGGSQRYTTIDPVNGVLYVDKDGSGRLFAFNLKTKTTMGPSFSVSGGSRGIDFDAGYITTVGSGFTDAVRTIFSAGTLSFGSKSTGDPGPFAYSVCKYNSASYYAVGYTSEIYKYDANTGSQVAGSGWILGSGDIDQLKQISPDVLLGDTGGLNGQYVGMLSINKIDNYNPQSNTGRGGLCADPANSRYWAIMRKFWGGYRLLSMRWTGSENILTDQDLSLPDVMEAFPAFSVLLLGYGSSLDIRDQTSLDIITHSTTVNFGGGFDEYSASRYLYYDKLKANGWLFSFTSGNRFRVIVIKLACLIPGCVSCGVDPVRFCEKCTDVVGSEQWLRNDTINNVCYTKMSIPQRYGSDVGADVLQLNLCTEARCVNCSVNNAKCVLCDPGYYIYKDKCLDKPNFPPSYGVSGIYALPCLDPGCYNCKDDNTLCVQCKPNFYVYDNAYCIEKPAFPLGYGVNTSSSIAPCLVNHCYYCQDDNTVCNACQPGYYKYLGSCIDKASFPTKYGISGDQVVGCAKINCAVCTDDASLCETCDATYYSYYGSCLNQPAFPPKTGVNVSAGTLVDCLDPHCEDCQASYLTCVKCDQTGGPLVGFYLVGNICMRPSGFPSRYGKLNVPVYRGVLCNDGNCTDCSADYMVCAVCDPGFYRLNSTTCVDFARIPSGSGINGKDIVDCSIAGCADCRKNYADCSCDAVNGEYWYPFNSTCIKSPFPPRTGIEVATRQIVDCSDGNCEDCKTNKAVCVKCLNSSSKPYLFDKKCIDITQIQPFYGINTTTNSVERCVAGFPHCILCTADIDVCTKCEDTSLYAYLLNNKCVVQADIPIGYGPDANGVIVKCTTNLCTLCVNNKDICTECETGYFAGPDGTTCFKPEDVPDYYGIVGGMVVPCVDSRCLNCKLNASTCVVYYKAVTKVILGGPEYNFDFMITIEVFQESLLGMTTGSAITDINILNQLIGSLINSTVVTIRNPETNEIVSGVDTTHSVQGPRGSSVVLYVKLANPTIERYNVDVSSQEARFAYNGTQMGTRGIEAKGVEVSFPESASNGLMFPGQKTFMNPMSGVPIGSTGQSILFASVGSGVSLVDGGLTIIKFGQFIKLLTKIQFVNINFGSKLGAFLMTATDVFKPPFKQGDSIIETKHSVGFRARITKGKIPLSFASILLDKISMYAICWVVRVILFIKFLMRDRPGKMWLVAMHWWPKIHMIVFNMNFMDFMFYGNRAANQTRAGETIHQFIAIVVLSLLSADFFIILTLVYSDKRWLTKLKRKLSDKKTDEMLKKLEKEELENNSGMILTEPDVEKKTVTDSKLFWIEHPEEGYEYDIDYTATFESLEENFHALDYLDGTLTLSKKVYMSRLARSHMLVALLRLSAYQFLITSGQYTSGLLIASLMVCELGKFAHQSVCYAKYKHLASLGGFIAETLQSIFLMTFLVICFILHFKKLTEPVHLTYQLIGIWLIISAVGTEYLLLIINSLVLAVYGIRESKLKKKIEAKLKELKKKQNIGKTKLQLILEEKSKYPIKYAEFHPNMIHEARMKNYIDVEEWNKHLERNKYHKMGLLMKDSPDSLDDTMSGLNKITPTFSPEKGNRKINSSRNVTTKATSKKLTPEPVKSIVKLDQGDLTHSTETVSATQSQSKKITRIDMASIKGVGMVIPKSNNNRNMMDRFKTYSFPKACQALAGENEDDKDIDVQL